MKQRGGYLPHPKTFGAFLDHTLESLPKYYDGLQPSHKSPVLFAGVPICISSLFGSLFCVFLNIEDPEGIRSHNPGENWLINSSIKSK